MEMSVHRKIVTSEKVHQPMHEFTKATATYSSIFLLNHRTSLHLEIDKNLHLQKKKATE